LTYCPAISHACRYGAYYRRLSKKVQAELAGANAVAEEAIGTMTTVKAHAAEGSVEAAYTSKLGAFYILQRKEAIAYSLYMTTNTFLSAAVVAAVLFYGGNLVLAGRMSSGALVSFLLYQQSLSAAFQALGDVFSALSAAVGAADKVIELMNRQPAFQPGGTLAATDFFGRIELRDVRFAYPARPQAQVLRGFSLTIEPGEVVALVGEYMQR
jgi:ATP-binding cassette, subfamily B (MDR/TAP), member 9